MMRGQRTYPELSTRPLDSTSSTSNAPLISVIVVNYNGLKVIQRCLHSVLQSTYPRFEVIAVDNASTDGSPQLIYRRCKAEPRLKLIASQSNLGFAEGCNLGASKANGRYLIFLNSDTETERDAIANLVAALEQSPSIGAAQSKLLMMTDKKRLDSAGDIISTIGWPHSLGKYEIDQGQYDVEREVFSARGAVMIVRKSIFQEVGGFDSDYFMYYEDLDLSWRIRLRGYAIAFVPLSVVYHVGGGLSELRSLQGTMRSLYSGRNYLATLMKNLELRNLLVYGSAHIAVHIGTMLLYLSEGRVHEALGLILALLSATKNLPATWRKRLLVQQTIRSIPDTQIFKHIKMTPITDYLRRHVVRRTLAESAGLRPAMR